MQKSRHHINQTFYLRPIRFQDEICFYLKLQTNHTVISYMNPLYSKFTPPFQHIIIYIFTYLAALDAPIRFISPFFTIAPSTASTVVGLTSGRILQISALEIGVRLLSTVASTRAFFVIFLPFTTANRLSNSL